MSTRPNILDNLIIEEIEIVAIPMYEVAVISVEELTASEMEAYTDFEMRGKE